MENIIHLLQTQFHVIPPADWLEACLDWIQQESDSRQLHNQELTNHVYEQWLSSNLKDIGARCFPAELINCDKYILKGFFAVQVDSVKDVSGSYYSQLKTLKGQDNPNLDVTATQQTQKPWEAKGSRMLMLTLTDGEIEVKGMEYQTIPAFNVPIHAGSKILIKGDVLSRLGVLFLKRDNVVLLGGEVDELVEANTEKNILAGALEENVEKGKGPPAHESKKFKSDRKKPKKSFSSSTQSTQSHAQFQPIVIKPEPSTSPPTHNSHWPRGPGGDAKVMKDDFEDDEFLDNIDTKQLDELEMRATQQENNMAWEEEDVDYDVLMEQMDFQDNHGDQGHSVSNASTRLTSHSEPGNSGSKRKFSGSDYSAPQHGKPFSNNFHQNATGSNSTFSGPRQLESYNSSVDNSVANLGYNANRQDRKTGSSGSHQDSDMDPLRKSTHIMNCNKTGYTTRPQDPPAVTSEISGAINTSRTIKAGGSSTPDSKPSTKQSTLRGFLKPKAELSTYLEMPPTSLQLKQGMSSPVSSDDGNSSTADSLASLSMMSSPHSSCTLKIQANIHVTALLSKLEHNAGRCWTLTVKLTDGSTQIDCDFADQLLATLIGFTATECTDMRKKAKQDKQMRSVLSQGIMQCQTKLSQLNCPMEIRSSPELQRPMVTQFFQQ